MEKKFLKYLGYTILTIFIIISYILWSALSSMAMFKYNFTHPSINKYIYFEEPLFKIINVKNENIKSDFLNKFSNMIMTANGAFSDILDGTPLTKTKNKELFLIKGYFTYTKFGSFYGNFKEEYYILEDSNKITFVVNTKVNLYGDKTLRNIEEIIYYLDNKTREEEQVKKENFSSF